MLVVTACTGGDDGGDAASATPSTAAPVERSTGVEAPLVIGQCGDVDGLRVGAALDPASVVAVDCDQPHDVEVAAVFNFPAGADLRFPGETAVDGYATDQCLARFEDYVGAPYESSSLDVAFVAPGEDGWEDGDRRIACVLYHLDFAPLTGSVRGSGR